MKIIKKSTNFFMICSTAVNARMEENREVTMFQEKRSMFADRNRVVFKAIIVSVIAIIMIQRYIVKSDIFRSRRLYL